MKKYPYNYYLSKVDFFEWIKKAVQYNKFWIYKLKFNLNKKYLNDTFELEILKYHYDKKFNDYQKYYFFGGFVGFLCYCLLINYFKYYEGLKWGDKDLDFLNYIRIFGRTMRFKFWEYIEGGIFLLLPPDEKLMSFEIENQWLEKKKRLYLLSLQIKNYEKYKNNKYEYLNFDSEEVFEIK